MTDATQKIWALIPAAGIGSRMQSEVPKQYLELGDKTILEHSIDCFSTNTKIHKVVVVINPNDEEWPKLSVSNNPKIVSVYGGHERADSVLNGLQKIIELGGAEDWVMVHDAARPCLASQHIEHLLMARESSPDGAILAIPSVDTVKVANSKQTIDKTIDRESIWLAQTPQFFPCQPLVKAINAAKKDEIRVTDEASAMEAQGLNPALVIGSRKNLKITEPDDLLLASVWLNHR